MPKTHRTPSQGNQSPTKRRRNNVEDDKSKTSCLFIPQKSMKYEISRNSIDRFSPENNVNDQQSKGGGRITNVQLKNFMNHSRLDWSPIKNVNIITGPNGSGKSSILQAIVLGLGGTARSMKRHKSVGKFVQKSQTKAEVKITLCNNDNDPFKRDVYGDSIIFERILYATGLSVYSIKNESSIVVCTGKQASIERERILDHYNILLDNPVTILHQEQAKVFFSQKDTEKNLWEFVMASTQMKSIHDEYRDSKTQLELAQSKLLDKIKHLEDGKNELRELQQQEKAFEKFQFDNKNKKYNEMIKWGYANDCEKKYKTAKKQREEKLSEIKVLENDLNGWIGSLEGLNRNKQQIELKNSEIKDMAQEKEEEIRNIKENVDLLIEKKRELEIRFKEITDKQGEKRKLVQKINSDIRTGKSLGHNNVTNQHNCNLVDELQELEQRIEQNSNEIKRLGHGRDTIESSEEKIEKEKTDVRLILKQKNNELTYRQNFLSKIENQSLRRFGENMTRLNKEIEDYSRGSCVFTKRPIGPIGRYIRLTPDAAGDDKLAQLLEVELGIGLLKSYICNCRKDRIQLEKIMQQVWSPGKEKPPIIYTRTFFNRKYNYNELSRFSVDTRNTNLTRVIDCLEVDDTIEGCNVFNLIVDQKNIEQVLITTTDQVEMLFSRIDTVPRNTKSAITREKFRYFPPSRYQNYSSYYMPQSRKLGPPLLIGDFRDEEKQNLQAIHNIEKEISDINDKYTKINNEERNLKEQSKSIIEKQLQLKQVHSSLLMEMTKIRAEIREGDENKKSTDDLIKQRDECHQEIQNLEKAKRPLLNEKDDLFKIILKLEDSMKEARGEVNRIYSESCDTSDLQREVEGKEREIKRLKKQLGKCSNFMQVLENDERKLEKQFKKAETDALKYCNNRRVTVTKDTRELDALKKEYDKQQKEFLKSVNGQSYYDINHKRICKDEQLKCLQSSLMVQKSNLQEAFVKLERRKAFFTKMRSMSMRGISRDFTNQMDSLNLEGTLTPEYKAHLIHVNVQPKNIQLENCTTNCTPSNDLHPGKSSLANLSGGERSKTLVCLINALWNVQPPPLRCLDEWDVFLDAVARKNVETMLVSTALRSGYQYIFISPQGSVFSELQQSEWKIQYDEYKDKLKVFSIKK